MSFAPRPDTSAIQNRCATFYSYFGSKLFASMLAAHPLLDMEYAENLALNVISDREILETASHHGNIGARKVDLDDHAKAEQGNVNEKDEPTVKELRALDQVYIRNHGIKFMVSAKGKSGDEMLQILKERIGRPTPQEWRQARTEMFKIFQYRLEAGLKARTSDGTSASPIVPIHDLMDELFKKHSVSSATVTATWTANPSSTSSSSPVQEISGNTQTGQEEEQDDQAEEKLSHWHFGTASKLIATTFCVQYFADNNIDLSTPANHVLDAVGSKFRLAADVDSNQITLEDLLADSAVTTTHRVVALRSSTQFPPAGTPLTNSHLLEGLIKVVRNNGDFIGDEAASSSAGLIVCQHIIQCHVKDPDEKPLSELTSDFFAKCGVAQHLFYPGERHTEDDESVESLAFGLRGCSSLAGGFHKMLLHLAAAYHDRNGSGGISHDTARRVLFSSLCTSDKNSFLNVHTGLGSGASILHSVSGNKFIVVVGGDNSNQNKYLALQCFDGADRGKGFVVASACDDFNVDLAIKGCCRALVFRGFDFYGAETQKQQDQYTTNQRCFYRDRFLRFFERTNAADDESDTSEGKSNVTKISQDYRTTIEEVAARFASLPHDAEFDAASLEFGGQIVAAGEEEGSASQNHFSSTRLALSPHPPLGPLDGFAFIPKEKSAAVGSELKISFHHPVTSLRRIELDFTHTTAPHSIEIFGERPRMTHLGVDGQSNLLVKLVPITVVKHFSGGVKVFDLPASGFPVEAVVVKAFVDQNSGKTSPPSTSHCGFNRIKCFAKKSIF